MRKILSQKEIESKRKTNTLMISVLMLGVLFLGTIGYGFMSSSRTSDDSDENVDSNIKNIGDRWEITSNGKTFYLENSPDEVKNISMITDVDLSDYKNSPLYVSSDNNVVTGEIFSVLSKYAPKIQKACYGPCDEDLPEKNCTDNLIIWRDSQENRVYQEENCIFIEGDLRAVDAFLYGLLGFN